MNITTVPTPPAARTFRHYPGNRAPLLPNPLAKLPPGAVRPRGWLAHQLELMADGMVGRLPEISAHLGPENGWLDIENPDWLQGWEEQPYWFRGFQDLALMTGRSSLQAEAERWRETVVASQDADGYFGPKGLKAVKGKDGRVVADLWPHMVMIDALIHHHEATGDTRILEMLTRFFRWCHQLPPDAFIPVITAAFDDWHTSIQRIRAGDFIPQCHWLYNKTGDEFLLDVAAHAFRRLTAPHNENLDIHIVNFTQRFAYFSLYHAQSHNPAHAEETEYWYRQHMATWGQQPRGIFGADECVREGKTDPRQGFETCGFVEFGKANYLLGRLTGNTIYADRTEDFFYNHFPASQTPELKGLHYLTASNLPSLDANQHDFKNEGRQVDYSPHRIYRCCQHNVAMGWPWFAQNLWQATSDSGLAAWMYAASEVTAKVGEKGAEVAVTEETDYPFRGKVWFTVHAPEPVEFPLYLRIPRWCRGLILHVNSRPVEVECRPGEYVCLERTWRAEDTIALDLEQDVTLTWWPRTAAVTVDRGPLSYSVRIEEEWRQHDKGHGTPEWPDWEVLPKSAWNYALDLEGEGSDATITAEVEEKEVPEQPWALDAAPVELTVRARKVPTWTIGDDNTIAPLHPGPIRTTEPEETIKMVPLGCARLRVSVLPVVGEGREASDWPEAGKEWR